MISGAEYGIRYVQKHHDSADRISRSSGGGKKFQPGCQKNGVDATLSQQAHQKP
jgi:hypothetical protein